MDCMFVCVCNGMHTMLFVAFVGCCDHDRILDCLELREVQRCSHQDWVAQVSGYWSLCQQLQHCAACSVQRLPVCCGTTQCGHAVAGSLCRCKCAGLHRTACSSEQSHTTCVRHVLAVQVLWCVLANPVSPLNLSVHSRVCFGMPNDSLLLHRGTGRHVMQLAHLSQQAQAAFRMGCVCCPVCSTICTPGLYICQSSRLQDWPPPRL